MVEVTINISSNRSACDLRTLLCRVSMKEYLAAHPYPSNPLIDTEFNKVLDDLAQQCFEEGRRYERSIKHEAKL